MILLLLEMKLKTKKEQPIFQDSNERSTYIEKEMNCDFRIPKNPIEIFCVRFFVR